MRLKNESSLNSTSLRSTNMSSPQSLKLSDTTVDTALHKDQESLTFCLDISLKFL